MVKACCVKGCNSQSYADCGISFHSFPKDENLRAKWLDALGGDPTCKNPVVCSRHFKIGDFKLTNLPRLTDEAVPFVVSTVKTAPKRVMPPILIKTESKKSTQNCDSSTDEYEIPINSAVEVREDPLSDVLYIKEEDDLDLPVTTCVVQEEIDVFIKEESEINQESATLPNEDFFSELTADLTDSPDSTDLLKLDLNNDMGKELRRRILRERKLIQMIKSLKNQNLRLKKLLAEFRKAEKIRKSELIIQ